MISTNFKKQILTVFSSSLQIQSSDTEFCLQLCAQFSVPLQLSSAADIITYLAALPEEKTDGIDSTVLCEMHFNEN